MCLGGLEVLTQNFEILSHWCILVHPLSKIEDSIILFSDKWVSVESLLVAIQDALSCTNGLLSQWSAYCGSNVPQLSYRQYNWGYHHSVTSSDIIHVVLNVCMHIVLTHS